jgi:hypothetical protein
MRELIKTFKKAGGKQLLYGYWKSNLLGFAIIEMLLLGCSKKALEILRLSMQYKIQCKLKRKYRYVLDRCDGIDYENYSKQHSDKLWVCWLQGMENAPLLVQRCHDSLKKYLNDTDIVLITSDNMFDYVQFPNHIVAKWKKGVISNTHLSDLLRLELLIKYGGTWIDATVLCTGNNIPHYIFNSELFFYQLLKPGKDGHSLNMSNWFISATSNSKVLLIVRELLYEYWLKNNCSIDYFIFHTFVNIVLEKYPEEQKKIFKSCNSIPHILQLEMFESYDEDKFKVMKQSTCFHKLTYKIEKELLEKKGTYYDVIIERGLY